MPLPSDYDSPAGEAVAEGIIRQALADCFLASGSVDYGFIAGLVHARPRYPRTNEAWLAIATIDDPDTTVTTGSTKVRIVRYFSAKLKGFKRQLQKLTLRYEITISFGFKDEYTAPALAGKNSHDELAACAMRYQKYLADNLNLGLDERITHLYLEMDDNRFKVIDKQGNASENMTGRIDVVMNVC